MKKFNRVVFSSITDNWRTPTTLLEELDKEFHFDFDPCPLNPIPELDGLTSEWGGCSFVNPPYSDLSSWCKKAFDEYNKGKVVVMLIPSRTDTKYWHEYIMKATEIRFIKGRLKFGEAKNSAPFPSCVVIFDGRGD